MIASGYCGPSLIRNSINDFNKVNKSANALASCQGCFCNRGQKIKNDQNLPLDSLEVIIYGECQAQNSQCIANKGYYCFNKREIKTAIKIIAEKYTKI